MSREKVMSIPKELLAITLVQLASDVIDGALDAGNNDVLNGVHTTVCDLDDIVQRHEGGLQRSQLNKQLNSLGPRFRALANLLASF
jgi:hypothetical protein